PRLHARHVVGLEELGPDAERPLDGERRLELRAHGWRDADQRAAAHVARLAADHVAETLKDAERAQDHRARLGRRVELADDADRVPGAPGGEEAALQHEHSPHAEPGQVEGERGAGDAPADDDDVGGGRHVRPAATTAAASPAPTTRARRTVSVSTSRVSGRNEPTASTWVPGRRSAPAKRGVGDVVAHVTMSAPLTAARGSWLGSTAMPSSTAIAWANLRARCA